MNPRRAPRKILATHAAYQLADLGINRWPADLPVPGFPSQIRLEALAMPSNNGGGLDDDEHGTPISPESREPYPEDAVALPQSRTLGLVLQDGKLLPEGMVLGGQPGLSSKQNPKENEDYVSRTHAPLPNPLPQYVRGQA